MNILIYSCAFLPKTDGLVFRIKAFLDYFIDKPDINIILVTPNPNTINKYERYKIINLKGIVIPNYLNKTNRKDIYISDFYNSDKVYNQLYNICYQNKIDIIHIYQGDFSTGIFSLISTNLNIPLVYSWHTDVIDYNKVYSKNKDSSSLIFLTKLTLVGSCINNCDKILTVSNESRERLKNYNIINKDIGLIPIIIDTNIFYPIEKTPNDIFTALFVGRIDPEKNIEELLKTIINLKDIQLLIIGDGTSKKYLSDKYNSENIKFLGKIPRKELFKYYNQADVFINPSKTETLGFTTLESLACKTPVICMNEGGTRDIIRHQYNGLLYKTDYELIDNINKIRYDKNLTNKLISNGYDYIKDKDVPNSCKYILDLYKELKITKNKKLNILNLATLFIYIVCCMVVKLVGIMQINI